MTYTVRQGDTLSEIATKYDVDMWELADANGIRNPDYIQAGQALTIPGTAVQQKPAAPAAPPAEKGVSYADIGRAFMKALAKFEETPEYKELCGLLED